ncbi:hypothetical protein HV030_10255 [Citrobacter freundii]|nr:hypothetical protein [Citrobacter freundii]QMA46956.1 hypothetical protein HV030_10255 [Citrobacter freundii]
MGEKIIADALDTALARHYEQLGNKKKKKAAVVFMDGRWVAIRGDFTPDEIRDALEFIKRTRLTESLGKALADSSPFSMKDGQVFIKDAFIDNGAASAEYIAKMHISIEENDKANSSFEEAVRKAVQKECQPGGLIWRQRGR